MLYILFLSTLSTSLRYDRIVYVIFHNIIAIFDFFFLQLSYHQIRHSPWSENTLIESLDLLDYPHHTRYTNRAIIQLKAYEIKGTRTESYKKTFDFVVI